jgi:GMP synthase-like glutamine amidotransferase
LIGDALDAHGFACDYADLYKSSGRELAVSDADALIFMGGPMSVNDDLPYIHREIEFIRSAISRRQPVLGVCLGAQLIAKALGARVRANAVKEIGWFPVEFADTAARDPLFQGIEGAECVFHWHGETFDLPAGAELLVSSAACRHQAFRFGDRVYGLQFHLEVTPEMIAQWCRADAACGQAREAATPIDPNAHAACKAELARLVFGRWCGLVRGQVSARGACQAAETPASAYIPPPAAS